jgi:IclR family acetate operon transcriptional repressor
MDSAITERTLGMSAPCRTFTLKVPMPTKRLPTSSKDTSGAKQRKPSAITGLQIVEFLAAHPRGVRLGDIANAVQMDRGLTHRMISAMQEDGWIVPVGDTGSYAITARVIHIGAMYTSRLDLAHQAQPYMEQLRSASGETVFLGELRDDEVVCVDRRLSDQTLSVLTKVGQSWPLIGTSMGSAILSARCKRLDIDVSTQSEEVAATLSRGYARDFGRYRSGVESVAAPIRDSTGVEVGAIAITAPTSRVTDEKITQFGHLVASAAVEISARLGWTSEAHRLPPKAKPSSRSSGAKVLAGR